MEEIRPGEVIGKYRLVAEVARGGMGAVFRARHETLHRDVAVKVLRRELAADPEIVKRFLREGKTIARLDHPGIVQIFDVGKDGNHYYLAMEFVEGKDLQRHMEDHGPFSQAEALRIARKVSAALEHAHAAGIVHRDIKPSNIILVPDGSIRLTDFGIARLLEQDTNLTQAGTLVGTPTYMSPEQCRGSEVDARADLYSLGATLYTLVSGKFPFTSKNPARLISQILNDNPTPLESVTSGLSPAVAGLIRRLMAKLPAARFQTAKELRQAIDDVFRQRRRFAGDPARDEPARPMAGTFFLLASLLVVAAAFPVVWLFMKASGVDAARSGVVSPVEGDTPAAGGAGKTGPHRSPRETLSTRGRTHGRGGAAVTEYSRREMRSRLEETVTRFERALLSGAVEDCLKYVDPFLRRNPGLLVSLGRIIQQVEGLGPEPQARHTLTMGKTRADVFIFVQQPGSAELLKVPVTFHFRDGDWYLRPRGS